VHNISFRDNSGRFTMAPSSAPSFKPLSDGLSLIPAGPQNLAGKDQGQDFYHGAPQPTPS
jgi:hypothetical protein